ncbi:MAG: GerMN domain-containing protein [Propionibacteriaceae bacterium]|nr:GerMN domain-containing protein [Propionibacteriaceae bacterium]
MRRIVASLVTLLLVGSIAGCSLFPVTPPEDQPPAGKPIQLYVPDPYARTLVSLDEFTDGTAEDIMSLLVQAEVFPAGVAALDFVVNDDGTSYIDMNAAFLDAIDTIFDVQSMRMGSLVNTFLRFYDSSAILVTVEGEVPVTEDAVYDSPLEFYPNGDGFGLDDQTIRDGITLLPNWFGLALIWSQVSGDWVGPDGQFFISFAVDGRSHGIIYGTVGPQGCSTDSEDASNFMEIVDAEATGEMSADLTFSEQGITGVLSVDFSQFLPDLTLLMRLSEDEESVEFTRPDPRTCS